MGSPFRNAFKTVSKPILKDIALVSVLVGIYMILTGYFNDPVKRTSQHVI